MPLKNKKTGIVPWDYKTEDESYQIKTWILKKGKEYVTIEKDNNNKGKLHLQKDQEKRLSLTLYQRKRHMIN